MIFQKEELASLKDATDLGRTDLLNVHPSLLPDGDFALVGKTSSGDPVRKYPLTTPRLIQHAIHQLAKTSSTQLASIGAQKISEVLGEGRVGAAVAEMMEKRDLEVLEALMNPGELKSYSRGTLEPDPAEVGYVGVSSSSPSISLLGEESGDVLAEAVVEGLDDATIPIRTMADAEKLSSWASRNSSELSDKDIRSIACAVSAAYTAIGYSEVDKLQKVSGFVRQYAGTQEREGMRQELLKDRLEQLERTNCLVKVSEAVTAGKDAYTALFTGTMEVGELAANLTDLDTALGVFTKLPAYASLFQPMGYREDTEKAFFGDPDDPDNKIYAAGDTRMRAGELKRISLLNLKHVERFLGCELTEMLRRDPITTFETLDDAQQLAVLKFAENRLRGPWRDYNVG